MLMCVKHTQVVARSRTPPKENVDANSESCTTGARRKTCSDRGKRIRPRRDPYSTRGDARACGSKSCQRKPRAIRTLTVLAHVCPLAALSALHSRQTLLCIFIGAEAPRLRFAARRSGRAAPPIDLRKLLHLIAVGESNDLSVKCASGCGRRAIL